MRGSSLFPSSWSQEDTREETDTYREEVLKRLESIEARISTDKK